MKCLVLEKTKTVLVWLTNFIISLSLIDPNGWIIAEIPDWINFSIPSTNGKKASDAAIIISLSLNVNILSW